jgi:dienelactone hydrolase
VKPPQGKKSLGAILVLPDIYSVRVLLPHVRSGDRIAGICDALADLGYTVALAGIFRNEPFDEEIKGPDDGEWTRHNSFAEEGGVAWFQKQNYEKMKPTVVAVTSFLKDQTNGQAVGVLGFCYGSWLLSKTSAMGDVDFACAVGCHPATVLEQAVYGGDEIAMLNEIKQPTLFLWAGNDSEIYKEGGAGKAALDKSGGGVEEFNNMVHGWVSRGDVADETVQAGVTRAIHSMAKFFAEKMPKAD